MIYCMSDIHGRLDLLEKMLNEISLTSDDKLYILGDAICRGGGLAALQKIIELQEAGQAQFIRGNHEENFLNNITMFNPHVTAALRENHKAKQYYNPSSGSLLGQLGYIINNFDYAANMTKSQLSCEAAINLSGCNEYWSVQEYFMLPIYEQKKILDFIKNSPTYADIEVAGKRYRLVHAGLDQNKKPDSNIRQEFYMHKSPLKNTIVIFGHTSTKDINIMLGTYAAPRIWFDRFHNNDKIGLDCGAPFYGGKLACLRLDDMQEFYVNNTQGMSSYLGELNDFAKIYGLPVNPDFQYSQMLEEVSTIVNGDNL